MIGLLTFHWADDYGALLQAYALKHCLEELGGETEIIPYAPCRLEGRYRWFPLQYQYNGTQARFRFTWSVGTWVSNLLEGKSFWRRRQAMARFRRNLTTQKPLRKPEDIPPGRYTCVFVGSDQVWNPDVTFGLDEAYLGNFPRAEGCRLVSYAASFGRESLPAAVRAKFASCVEKNFDAVSLRERRAVPFVRELLGQGVIHTLDPVLLLEQAQWAAAASPPEERDYVLVYQTEYSEALMEYAHRTAQKLGTPVLSVSFPVHRETPAWAEPRVETGPAEFVGYVQNAACVVTNSFHGTAFSILFQKPFLVFPHSRLNVRIADLLETLGLERRMAEGPSSPGEERIWEEIDWAGARARLDGERRQSREFIRRQTRGGQTRHD